MRDETDVVVVGAGPIGLELAAGLKSAGVDYQQIEAGAIGSTIGWWGPGTRFFSSPERISIAGVPLVTPNEDKASREEYLAYLRQVVGVHGLDVATYRRVVGAARGGDGFALTVAASAHGVGGPAEQARRASGGGWSGVSRVVRAQRVVLAIGDMQVPRMLGIPGEDEAWVSHFLGETHGYFGRRVVIVGGKNSAVEAAIRLYRAGARVTLSYRGDELDATRIKYWLLPEIRWLIEHGRIGWEPLTVPVAIRAGRVELRPTGSDAARDTRTIEADHVLLLTGYEQDPALFEMLGVELVGPERRPCLDRSRMETSVAGVFVCGTAVAGSQPKARVFIENSHGHVGRIVAALTGREPPSAEDEDEVSLPEA